MHAHDVHATTNAVRLYIAIKNRKTSKKIINRAMSSQPQYIVSLQPAQRRPAIPETYHGAVLFNLITVYLPASTAPYQNSG